LSYCSRPIRSSLRAGEVGARQGGVRQVGVGEVSVGEVGAGEVGAGEVGVSEVWGRVLDRLLIAAVVLPNRDVEPSRRPSTRSTAWACRQRVGSLLEPWPGAGGDRREAVPIASYAEARRARPGTFRRPPAAVMNDRGPPAPTGGPWGSSRMPTPGHRPRSSDSVKPDLTDTILADHNRTS
jgi:hypothetical protein